jgi:hypothetical protein
MIQPEKRPMSAICPDIPYAQPVPRLYTAADGLASDDIRGVAVSSQGHVLVVTPAGLNQWDGQTWTLLAGPQEAARPDCPPEVLDDAERVWRATPQGLQRIDPPQNGSETDSKCSSFLYHTGNSGLLADAVWDVALDSWGHLWVATSRGLHIFDRQKGWLALTGPDGLPLEEVTHLALCPDGTLWGGTPRGVIRWRNGQWKLFAGRRWLPDDRVQALAGGPDGSAWIGTPAGLVHLTDERLTLAEKARRFEERIAARHCRNGYISSCRLQEPGRLDSFVHEASDNDGLWTALYVAAQSFQYAATGDPRARERARRSMEALRWLEAVTPIPGFPARAAVRRDEEVLRSPGEWHASDDGEWLWKGDTSSDEIDGHLFAFGVYYDLVADEPEKAAIAETVGRIMRHIVTHDFLLVDLDGQPTRWGVWGPSFLNGPWREQQGLNSLEILAHLRTAFHITRDPLFEAAYRDLIHHHHYALNTVRQKLVFPDEVNHSDDELAFLAYYSLLRYEEDPALRTLYLLSLERSWRLERPERNPLWNFIYGALTGNPCDVEASVQTLREIPLDLIDWRMVNSHRADIVRDEVPGRFGELQSVTVLPYDERAVGKWNSNPYCLDAGGDGCREDDGTYFLLPYWMGRYYGFIRGDKP